MTNILFIGSFIPDAIVEGSGGRVDSLYRDDQALIEGFRNLQGIKIDVVTSPDLPSYPKYLLYIKKRELRDEGVLLIPSLNLPIIKHIWTIFSICKEACDIIKRNVGMTYVIIPYVVFRHVMAARLIKWFCGKRVKVCTIVPDIFFPKNRFRRFVNKITERKAIKNDMFVLYTEAMANYLRIKDKAHIVIEGFHLVDINHDVNPPKEKFSIVYSGSLNARYGILRLIEAVMKIDRSNVELRIFGSGDSEQKIREYSKVDDRIQFFGRVSKKEASEILYNASVLVNPRGPYDGEYVQYSFPSKDIDYLASGIPAILCRLPGMPEAYLGHFVDAGDGSVECLNRAIMEVYNMSDVERKQMGESAKKFIAMRMDPVNQAREIVEMFNEN